MHGSGTVTRRFAKTVTAGTDDKLTKSVQADATIERVRIRIYSGAELSLELEPFVVRNESDRVSIIDLVGKSVVDGDDDTFDFPVHEPVTVGDTIGIDYNNTDGSNDYDFSADVVVDRRNGTEPVFEALKEVLQ